ncbi:18 kDa cyclophilin, putative [Eimeria acervulina]|uniref:Peptidyl-prolyl cis-trans isomerase n=1 Tax=Eimeria acervulina TaxID=5801 RepID=U6GT00_EIMAC|nr:18 kDa cyclophilin, putative [Eimeria acervulina]CDI83305.1 18 kDa cyclophilin, putative [Eimeria acervulina]
MYRNGMLMGSLAQVKAFSVYQLIFWELWDVNSGGAIGLRHLQEAHMEISIGGESIGFLNFSLRPDVVPKTVKNFVDLLPRYQGTSFHRIIPDFMVQGGDVQRNVLPGADTSPVPSFNDENFELKHIGPGILSMANAGRCRAFRFMRLDKYCTLQLRRPRRMLIRMPTGADICFTKPQQCAVAGVADCHTL